MKNNISYNGNVHSIVDGVDLYEMNNGTISHTLGENDDHFRFTVTGTNHSTGLRHVFRFLLNATIKRSARGSLDVIYVQGLIEDTVKDALAAENYFITGHVSRGQQFDRAFARHILTPNAAVSCLTGGRLLCFDGLHQGYRAKSEEARDINDALVQALESNRQFLIVCGQMIYTYSVEDQPKWGLNNFAPAVPAEGFNNENFEAILNHFSKLNGGSLAKYPVRLMMADEKGGIRRVADRKAMSEGSSSKSPAVSAPVRKPHPAVKKPGSRETRPVADVEYQSALAQNDRAMQASPSQRLPWRTNTGPVQQVVG